MRLPTWKYHRYQPLVAQEVCAHRNDDRRGRPKDLGAECVVRQEIVTLDHGQTSGITSESLQVAHRIVPQLLGGAVAPEHQLGWLTRRVGIQQPGQALFESQQGAVGPGGLVTRAIVAWPMICPMVHRAEFIRITRPQFLRIVGAL